jgi:hypothetical protein
MKTILHVIDTTGPGGAEAIFFDLASRLPADRTGWASEAVRYAAGLTCPVLCYKEPGPVCITLRRVP